MMMDKCHLLELRAGEHVDGLHPGAGAAEEALAPRPLLTRPVPVLITITIIIMILVTTTIMIIILIMIIIIIIIMMPGPRRRSVHHRPPPPSPAGRGTPRRLPYIINIVIFVGCLLLSGK